jgi:tetratricopeptide (TPR) repeat protein
MPARRNAAAAAAFERGPGPAGAVGWTALQSPGMIPPGPRAGREANSEEMRMRTHRTSARLAVVCVVALAVAFAAQAAEPAPDAAHADSLSALRDVRAAEAQFWPPLPSETDFDAQITSLKQRLQLDPQNSALYGAIAALCAAKRDWECALNGYVAAIQANRQDARSHLGLALAAVELGNTALAASELDVYQKLDPDGGPLAWRLMGAVWQLAGKRDKARRAFETGLMRLPAGTNGDRPERLRLALDLTPLVQDADGTVAARLLLEKILPEAQAQLAAATQSGDSTGTALATALVTNLLALEIGEANSQAGQGNMPEAAGLYAKAFALAPNRDDLLVFAVNAYLAAGKTEAAKALQSSAAAALPEAPGVWLAAGRIAEQEGRAADAIAAYQKSLALEPGQADLQLRVATLYLASGDAAAARKYMDSVMADPKAPASLVYDFAVALIREKKYEQAIGPLRRAVKDDPQLAAAWTDLGACLQATGKPAEAIEPYRKALALEKSANALAGLALSYARTAQTDQAIETYRELVATEPDFPGARYNLGRTLYDAQRYSEAVPVLEAALMADPGSYQICFLLGVCHYQTGEYQKAADMYKQALAQKRTSDLLQNLSLAVAKLGLKDEAEKYLLESQALKAAGQ